MSDAVDKLFEEFSVKLRALIRDEIVQSLLGAAQAPQGTARKTTVAKEPGKRTSETLNAQATAALAYIRKHPQCTAAEIAAGIGIELKDLTLPMNQLKEQKAVKTVGQKRGTKYLARP